MDRSVLDAAYAATDFVVTTPHGDATLRADGPPVGAEAALAHVAGRRVTVITAWNPRSVPQPADANAAANVRLRADLQAGGWRFWDATGRGRPGEAGNPWSADSFAVLDADVEAMRDLGRAHHQNSIFAWDGQRGAIIWCDD